jgi:hypothetical protein
LILPLSGNGSLTPEWQTSFSREASDFTDEESPS